jgi:hypothetical protein
VIDLSPAVLDGAERWYKLGQRTPDGKENVSGGMYKYLSIC